MDERQEILISMKKVYAARLLEGTKTVELRRRAIRVEPGSRVWIYSKAPFAAVVGFGIVKDVIEDDPAQIWVELGPQTGITKREFDDYFKGVRTACAIVFRMIAPVKPTLKLNDLRRRILKFHPPQFFKRLRHDGPELKLFVRN